MEIDFKDFFKGKKVLVTGHTGFKGSWLCIWLDEMGAEVVGYGLDPYYENSLFELSKISEKIIDIRADIRDLDKLEKVFLEQKPEIVIHMAAQAITRLSYDMPRETLEINIMGTINILECLKKYPVKSAVLITSDKCYKNVEQIKGYVETDRFSDQDPYSCSKGACELIIQSYRNSFGIKAASTRAGNVIGGGDWAKDRLVPDIIRSLENNKDITIRNPNSTRPWQFVLEPLYGYLILAKDQYNGIERNEGWNFGPERESMITVEKVTNDLVNKWGSGKVVVQKDSSNKHEAGLLFLDCTKSKTKLHWKPKLDVYETIDYIVEWYKNYKTENVYLLTVKQIRAFEKK